MPLAILPPRSQGESYSYSYAIVIGLSWYSLQNLGWHAMNYGDLLYIFVQWCLIVGKFNLLLA